MVELVKKAPPGVTVYQQFEELAPVILRPVMQPAVIAQAFHIAKDPAPVAGSYRGEATADPLEYPGLPAEAEVDDFATEHPGSPDLLSEVSVVIEDSADDFDVTADDQVVITSAGVSLAKCLQTWKTILSGTVVTAEEGKTRLTFPVTVDLHALGVRVGDKLRFATSANELIDPAESVISTELDDLTGLAQEFDIIAIPALNAIDVAILGEAWDGFVGEANVQAEIRRYPAGSGVLIAPNGDGAGIDIPASDTLTIVNPEVDFLADPVQPGDTFQWTTVQDEIVGDAATVIDNDEAGGDGIVGTDTPILTGNVFSDSGAGFVVAGVVAGDYLEFISDAGELDGTDGVVVTKNTKRLRITNVQAAALTLASRLITEAPAAGKSFQYRVIKYNQPAANANNVKSFRVVAVLSAQSLKVERAMTAEARSNGREFEFKITRPRVPNGTIRIGYRAIRGDLVGKYTEVQSDASGSSTFLVSKLGLISKDNPLAVMAVLATLNTTEAVGAVGIKHWDVAGVKAALDILGSQPQVYAIAMATHDPTLLSMLKAHVDKYSDPVLRKGEERYAIVNYRFPEQEVVIDTQTDADNDLTVESDRTQVSLGGSASVDFDDVLPNDILDFDPLGTGRVVPFDVNSASVDRSSVRVTARLTSTKLQLAEEVHTDQGGTIAGPWRVLTHIRESDELAQIIARTHNAIGDYRVVATVPHEVGISLEGVLERLPGYYACASVAGLRCGNAPGAPLSQSALPGIAKVYGADDKFSADQLDIIAGGGSWILVQDGQVVVTRQQLTTDISSIQKSEDSIRTALDYGAKVFRAELRPLMGKRNITDRFIRQELRPRCEGILAHLIEQGVFDTESSIIALERDPAKPDRVLIRTRILTLKPFNQADVVFLIS